MSRKMSIPPIIPSWTGFNISIRNDIAVVTTALGYLDCIDASASELSTINEVLQRCLKIKDSLKLKSIVCVFDEAIYAKAVEIKWKQPETYKSCIIMLGIFHTLMMFLGIFGKRFGDGGYRDLLVQSEVIAEGSVDRVLTGKMYNRSVRAVKLTFEALNRILIDMFEQDLDAKPETTEMLASVREEISTFTTDINNESFETLAVNQHFQAYRSRFDEFLENMKTNNGDLAQYWMSFLEMAQILLNVIFATRSGNWVLLLESLKDIVPYTFAYGNINYARYVILKYFH